MEELDVLSQGRYHGLKSSGHFWVQNVFFWQVPVGALSTFDALFSFKIFLVSTILLQFIFGAGRTWQFISGNPWESLLDLGLYFAPPILG
jgi:hypothetical protein